MAEHPTIISEAEAFVFEHFKRHLPEGLVYHTFSHSETVAETARKLAKASSLGEEGVEIVTLASWLHDLGYSETYKGHEEVSIRIGSEFLRSKNYPPEKIQLVVGCILATKVPQEPKNILEEIVADADLASLGRKSFFEQSELLRIEWERALHKTYTDAEWVEQNIDLLTRHSFFTRAARIVFAEQQADNLRKLYKRRQKLSAPPIDMKLPESLPLPAQAESRNGFYILLHAVAQRQLSAQFAVNQQAILLAAVSFLAIFISVRPFGHLLHHEAPDAIAVAMVLLTALGTIVLAICGYTMKGRYFEDSALSFSAFDEQVRELDGQTERLDEVIITDCYEHKRIVDKKQRYVRLATKILVIGLLASFLVHLGIHFL